MRDGQVTLLDGKHKKLLAEKITTLVVCALATN